MRNEPDTNNGRPTTLLALATAPSPAALTTRADLRGQAMVSLDNRKWRCAE